MGDRPAPHRIVLPHGVFVLLAWPFDWFMVPLVLAALFAGVRLSSPVIHVLRMGYGPCCAVMDASERMEAHATAVGPDLAGPMVVMLSAMFLFRALRR